MRLQFLLNNKLQDSIGQTWGLIKNMSWVLVRFVLDQNGALVNACLNRVKASLALRAKKARSGFPELESFLDLADFLVSTTTNNHLVVSSEGPSNASERGNWWVL